ncbi:MAG TPA: glycosyltransferase [Acidimicrobiia bacterium]|jgi:glycosyltransferase involved in cell wall biosynthesis
MTGAEQPIPTPRILIVEEHAHESSGHLPVRFAQLAGGYHELGFAVDALTTWGWSNQADQASAPFTVHTFGFAARQLRRVAGRLRGTSGDSAVRELTRRAGDALALVTAAAAIRSRARSMAPHPTLGVIIGRYTEPAIMAALVGRGNWLLFQVRAVERTIRWNWAPFEGFVFACARRAERTRRRSGGSFRIAAPSLERSDEWRRYVPFLDAQELPIAGVRSLEREADGHHVLGLPSDRRIALFFGSGFAQVPATVIEAFREIDDWLLVIAGRVADDIPSSEVPAAVLLPGYLDDATRDVLLGVADVMVLCFERDYPANSGTLMDAISVGVPVVCSDASAAAELVERFDLGPVFTAEDPDALRAAMARVPERIDPDDLARARATLSNAAVARAQLEAFGISAPC